MELLMNMIIDFSMEENHWSKFSGLNQILCGRSMLYRHQIKINHVSPSSSLQYYNVLSTIAQVLRKMSLKILAS